MNKSYYYLSIAMVFFMIMASFGQSQDKYLSIYTVPLKNQEYKELVYQTEVLYPKGYCGYITMTLKNTSRLPQGVTWDDFALVILYDENAAPANSIFEYANRKDALVFEHTYLNETYTSTGNDSETWFISTDLQTGGIPFPYSLMRNQTVPYYDLWKQRYELISNKTDWTYIQKYTKAYPFCISDVSKISSEDYDLNKDNPYAFKIVLYYSKSPEVNLELEILHTADTIIVSTSDKVVESPSQSTPTQETPFPLGIAIVIPFFTIVVYKKKQKIKQQINP